MAKLARDVMTDKPVCCRPETLLDEVARLMREYDCGEIPVINLAEQPIGVVTDRDIVCRLVAEGKNPMAYPAEVCMSQPVVVVPAAAPVRDVLALMETHQVRRVPVVDGEGRCVGIISQADIARRGKTREVAELLQELSHRGDRFEPFGMEES